MSSPLRQEVLPPVSSSSSLSRLFQAIDEKMNK